MSAIAADPEPPLDAEDEEQESGDPGPDLAELVRDDGAARGKERAMGDGEHGSRKQARLGSVEEIDSEGAVKDLSVDALIDLIDAR